MSGVVMAVTDPDTELRVVTSWPTGDPMAVVTGRTSGPRPCSADAGDCNRARMGPTVAFEPARFDAGTALSESLTSATEATADCAASDSAPTVGAAIETLDPFGAFNPGRVDAPAECANNADSARRARRAPTAPRTSVTGVGRQRNRTGSSV